jgi:hypothetical protein
LANCPATQTQMTFQPALPATALALFWMISDLAQFKPSQIKPTHNYYGQQTPQSAKRMATSH